MDAGWYDDPHEFGWLRYWDGESWTRNTAPRPANYRPPPPALPVYASLLGRFGAYLLDWMIVSVPLSMLIGAVWMLMNADAIGQAIPGLMEGGQAGFDEWMAAVEANQTSLLVMSLAFGPAWFAYEYACLRRWSATPGMMVLQIQVEPDDGTGDRLSKRSIAIRSTVFGVVELLAGLPLIGILIRIVFLFDCLSMTSDLRRRTWHDRWAGTIVTNKPRAAQGPDARQWPRGP